MQHFQKHLDSTINANNLFDESCHLNQDMLIPGISHQHGSCLIKNIKLMKAYVPKNFNINLYVAVDITFMLPVLMSTVIASRVVKNTS